MALIMLHYHCIVFIVFVILCKLGIIWIPGRTCLNVRRKRDKNNLKKKEMYLYTCVSTNIKKPRQHFFTVT